MQNIRNISVLCAVIGTMR